MQSVQNSSSRVQIKAKIWDASTDKNGVAPNTNCPHYKNVGDILKVNPQIISAATFSSGSQILTLVLKTRQSLTEVPMEEVASEEESRNCLLKEMVEFIDDMMTFVAGTIRCRYEETTENSS
ncbi:hypothetical protein F4703DRAFT_1923402 [Phycomyces blakesleeanus]